MSGATTTSDDTTEVSGANLDFELGAVTAFDFFHAHGIGIVHDRTNDVGEDGHGRGRGDLIRIGHDGFRPITCRGRW